MIFLVYSNRKYLGGLDKSSNRRSAGGGAIEYWLLLPDNMGYISVWVASLHEVMDDLGSVHRDLQVALRDAREYIDEVKER